VGNSRRILDVDAWRRLVIAIAVAALATGIAGAADPAVAASSKAAANSVNAADRNSSAHHTNAGNRISAANPTIRAGTFTPSKAPKPAPVPEWPAGGQNVGDDRFQPDETTIYAKTAARLTPRWTLMMAGDVSATPAVVNGVVYVPDWGGYISAIRANNGHVIWRRLVSSYNGIAGSVSRTDPVVSGSTLVIGTQTGADMIAINTATGARKWVTRADAHPAAQITGSAVIYKNVVYVGVSSSEEASAENPAYKCCTFRGSVVALRESTGKVLWKTYTVPANGGKPGGYSGGTSWVSTPAIDPATNSVYVGTGNNYLIPATADKCVANAMKNHTSDAKCTAADKPETLIGDGQKSGIYWTFNPATGRLVWDILVGPGSPDGGALWGTASDGTRVYVADGNSTNTPFTCAAAAGKPGRPVRAAPGQPSARPPGTSCGRPAILWSFASGGSVAAGPAIVGGSVYWGSGYSKSGSGSASKRLYAFGLAAVHSTARNSPANS
jgi:polyvinyl alcohol dehydrogenase (cytochrome)